MALNVEQASKSPLGVLSPMLTMVIIQCGKVFTDPRLRNPQRVTDITATVTQAIPVALDKFHSALDDLEIEILKAKAAFTRDLALTRSIRVQKEHEAAAAAEKARTEAEAALKAKETPAQPEAVTLAVETPMKEDKDDDILMIGTSSAGEAVADKGGDAAAAAAATATKVASGDESKTPLSNGNKEKPTAPTPLDMSNISNKPSTSTAAPASSNPTKPNAEQPEATTAPTVKTPSTAGLMMDASSFFTDGVEGGDLMDFNFGDFSAGGHTSAEGDGGAGKGDMASLMTGLDDFTGSGVGGADIKLDDSKLQDLDIDLTGDMSISTSAKPPTNTSTSQAPSNLPATAPAQGEQQNNSNVPFDLLPPEETNFDDFMNGLDWDTAGGGGDGGSGTLGDDQGDFDNALFGIMD